MANDFGDLGRSARLDRAVDAFDQIDSSAKQLPSPALVPDAVSPERFSCEG